VAGPFAALWCRCDAAAHKGGTTRWAVVQEQWHVQCV
jgi:hypothetical protein